MVISNWLTNWRGHRERARSRRQRRIGAWQLKTQPAECLEARALLSNVAVTTDGGVIRLSGDAGDHDFTAAVVDIGGVQNLELTGSGGTEFTFGSTTTATLDIPLSTIGPVKGLEITMQDGNDAITFGAANLGTISGDVIVKLGDGTNSFTFQEATVTSRTIVDGGSGVDTVQMSSDTLGALSICTGDGGDTVGLSVVAISGEPAGPPLGDFGGGPNGILNGLQRLLEHARHGLDGALNISTGSGDDTVNLGTVTGASGEESQGPWSVCDHLWSLGRQWRVSLGSGDDNVVFDTVQTNRSLSVNGGSGDDTVNMDDSTINGRARVALASGQDQISVETTTFVGPARLSTGPGDGQSISVDDSTFESSATFVVPGADAQLNLETAHVSDTGTTFQGPVAIFITGPSAVANFSGPSPDNTLTFEGFVSVFGGVPAATVNVDVANTTLDDDKLFLFNADRNNV